MKSQNNYQQEISVLQNPKVIQTYESFFNRCEEILDKYDKLSKHVFYKVNNRFRVMKYIKMNHIIDHDYILLIKWLDKNNINFFSKNTLNYAIRKEKIEIIKWLHDHRSEEYTMSQLLKTAKYGSFEIITWLYNHKTKNTVLTTTIYKYLEQVHKSRNIFWNKSMDSIVQSICQKNMSFLLNDKIKAILNQ